MAGISGSVVVTGDPDDWIVSAFDADTLALGGSSAVSSGSYSVTGLTAGKAYILTARPKTGPVWSASANVLKNNCIIPADPSATPYIYKATATPDGDAYFASVALLLHGEGTDTSTTIADSSSGALSVTANGDAQIDTAQHKYGSASILLDGTTDYLSVSDSALAIAAASSFTLECWVRPASLPSTKGGIFYNGDPASNNDRAQFELNPDGTVGFYMQAGTGTGSSFTSSATLSTAAWIHLAVCKSGTDIKVFVGGMLSASGTYSTAIAANSDFYVGLTRSSSANYYFDGHIDDVRITPGVARYSADFAPLTRAFPDMVADSGYTGGAEPTWPTVAGNTVVDNEITWTNMGRLIQPISQGPLIAS